jgi:mono/diheme cytochrome c family protein
VKRHRRERTSRAWTIAAMMALVVGGVIVASRQATRTVTIAQLSPVAQAGQQTFGRNCASCHGERAQGTLSGPPLVHSTYRSEHHSDAAFERAVRLGVRAHHWNRGHMPPQPAVTPSEVGEITRYIRELQQANGIR